MFALSRRWRNRWADAVADDGVPVPASGRSFLSLIADPRYRPSWLVEAAVAIGAVAGAVLARLAIEQVVGGIIPFALTFPAVMGATLLAGAGAGVFAMIGCQLLTLRFVFPNWTAIHGGEQTDAVNLLLTTGSLLAIIWAMAAYRHKAGELRTRCEREVTTLSLVIREIDHRTKNNLQIASALLLHRAHRAEHGATVRELSEAANQLEAIAGVYARLSLAGADGQRVDLADHLRCIVAHLRTAMLRDQQSLSLIGDDAIVDARIASMVGLIVNEWVTNAVKYALNDGRSSILVEIARQNGKIRVSVQDEGKWLPDTQGSGAGSKLIDGLAKAIDGTVTITHDAGTRCELLIAGDHA